MRDVAGILLAAGGSRRLGEPKQLLAYRGRPLLHHAASVLLATPCRPVLVVLGAEGERARAALDGLPVEIVDNARWSDGVGTSIAAGIAAAAAHDVAAAVLALVDQPLVTAASFERLLAMWRTTRRPIVASRYAGTVGVPALFAAELFPRLRTLDRDHGCKPLIRAAGARAALVDCPEAATDVDTPADYTSLLGSPAPDHDTAAATPPAAKSA